MALAAFAGAVAALLLAPRLSRRHASSDASTATNASSSKDAATATTYSSKDAATTTTSTFSSASGPASAASLPSRPRASHPRVHVLLVRFTFGSAEDRQRFTDWWRGLADRVYANEPRCLSYELSFDITDDTKAIIYERYVAQADLDGLHQESIKAQVQAAGPSDAVIVSKELTSYTETNIGHMDR
jgi:quinol monooxygenase YgiN